MDETPDVVQRAKQGLAEAEGMFGSESPQAVTALKHLAGSLSSAGRHEDALGVWQRALDLSETTFGPIHPDTVRTLVGLAGSLSSAGRHEDALGVWQRALDLSETTFGPIHPDTVRTLVGLAGSLSSAGRHEDALGVWQRALDLSETTFGPIHPDTVRTLVGLAGSLSSAGRHEDALGVWQRALDTVQEVEVGKRGRFFTPRQLTQIMADLKNIELASENIEGLLDASAGHGSFLHSIPLRELLNQENREAYSPLSFSAHDLKRVDRLIKESHVNFSATEIAYIFKKANLLTEGQGESSEIPLDEGCIKATYSTAVAREELAHGDLVGDGSPEAQGACGSRDTLPSDDVLSSSEVNLDVPSLDELFASHAARVTEVLEDAAHDLHEARGARRGVDAVKQRGPRSLIEAQRLAREAREAVNSDLIALFLKLGPPPEVAGKGNYEPVNSGGGGTRE
ncbi:tetratricopeptide repeat protein [Streptomyces sp. DSM 41931]|uniref:tetratricopeptide repeat protein n=1 Tax=Streptomyces sp. DSM 41931 TaxID=3418367 RepID=UPI003D01E51E